MSPSHTAGGISPRDALPTCARWNELSSSEQRTCRNWLALWLESADGSYLIAPLGSDVYAIADGIVEVESKDFYRTTNYIAIRHKNGFVARYCEILANDQMKGDVVREGQIIAHIGKMFADSMLHFELYAGTETGPLTQRDNPPYQRRRDLTDPTSLLDRLAWTLFE